jgi:multiple sugar transport system permease protein
MISIFEAANIDLSPIWSGQGFTFVGNIPFYSGGFFPTLIHFEDALTIGAFPRLAVNSVIIGLSSVSLALIAGIPAAYGLARLKFKGQSIIAYLLLALRTVSPFAIVIPLFILYNQTGLWDTYTGMAIAYMVIDVPVVVWLLRGFFADIPRETYEAAEISGASERQIFQSIALPSVALGIVATAIFAIILVWNEFLIAEVLTGPFAKTVSVGIWNGLGDKFDVMNIDWDEQNAVGTLAFIPVVALLLVIKRYLAKGFTLGMAS